MDPLTISTAVERLLEINSDELTANEDILRSLAAHLRSLLGIRQRRVKQPNHSTEVTKRRRQLSTTQGLLAQPSTTLINKPGECDTSTTTNAQQGNVQIKRPRLCQTAGSSWLPPTETQDVVLSAHDTLARHHDDRRTDWISLYQICIEDLSQRGPDVGAECEHLSPGLTLDPVGECTSRRTMAHQFCGFMSWVSSAKLDAGHLGMRPKDFARCYRLFHMLNNAARKVSASGSSEHLGFIDLCFPHWKRLDRLNFASKNKFFSRCRGNRAILSLAKTDAHQHCRTYYQRKAESLNPHQIARWRDRILSFLADGDGDGDGDDNNDCVNGAGASFVGHTCTASDEPPHVNSTSSFTPATSALTKETMVSGPSTVTNVDPFTSNHYSQSTNRGFTDPFTRDTFPFVFGTVIGADTLITPNIVANSYASNTSLVPDNLEVGPFGSNDQSYDIYTVTDPFTSGGFSFELNTPEHHNGALHKMTIESLLMEVQQAHFNPGS